MVEEPRKGWIKPKKRVYHLKDSDFEDYTSPYADEPYDPVEHGW